jgi:transposase
MSGRGGGNQAIRYSLGALNTKIQALVDALGNPLAFLLTPGQAHDLAGAHVLLPQNVRRCAIADNAFDLGRSLRTGGSRREISDDPAPTKPNHTFRLHTRKFYKARQLCKLNEFRASATFYAELPEIS